MKAGWKTVGSAKRKTWNSLGFLVLTLSAAKMRSENLKKSLYFKVFNFIHSCPTDTLCGVDWNYCIQQRM